ncbi:MAG: hypothetical protein AAGC72_04015 [Planctomycetota bacterium]
MEQGEGLAAADGSRYFDAIGDALACVLNRVGPMECSNYFYSGGYSR